MAVVLDTSAYSVFSRGTNPALQQLLLQADEILLPTVVIGELRAGFAHGSQQPANEQLLARFLDQPRVTVITITDTTTRTYANIYAELRRAGTPISPNDLWVAAQAIEHNAPLVTTDSDFSRVPGLQLAPLG